MATYFSATSAHTCTGDGGGMCIGAGIPMQDMEFVQFHPTGIYGSGCLITEGSRERVAILLILKESVSWSVMHHLQKTLHHDVVSRAMTIEIKEGRRG